MAPTEVVNGAHPLALVDTLESGYLINGACCVKDNLQWLLRGHKFILRATNLRR